MEMLHFALLVVTLCAMFIVGIVVGREWERVAQEEEREKKDKEKDTYFID
jgi:Na+-transporting methylmalonyl-CoA/oxaloacetate decarboxylase gamma subunit